MDMSGVLSTMESAGIKVNFLKLLPLASLLTKKAVDIDDRDITKIFQAFDLPYTDTKLVVETAQAIKTSNFDTVADIISDDNYFIPLMTRVLTTQKPAPSDEKPAKVGCMVCDGVVEIPKSDLDGYQPHESIVKTCVSCKFPNRYFVGQIAQFWSQNV